MNTWLHSIGGCSWRLRIFAALCSAILLFAGTNGVAATSNEDKSKAGVKLVLQLTIDQLRGDQPLRFKDRFGPGGFRYLMDRGVVYTNAHYAHADTETGPGHATLTTGGHPAQHGIVGGDWYDVKNKKIIYSVEDNDYPVFNEVIDDEPGKTAGGRSPTNLLSSTIADEIYIASDHKAKIFAVSGKDRSAILPGGRVGKAFWLSHGDFTTSAFYYKEPPAWLIEWNNRKLANSYRDKSWQLLHDSSTYSRVDRDDQSYEGTYKHLGRTMPKKLANDNDKHFYKGLEQTIVSDQLVAAFTEDLIEREKIGQRGTVDYLSVSLSSTDYVGHLWGISSLEAEDNILRVDNVLSELFAFIDKKVGLDKTLIVLSSDHGAGEVTEYMQSLRFPAKRIEPRDFQKQVEEALQKRFSITDNLIESFVYPYFYLNMETIQKHHLKVLEVERAAAEATMNYPGIYFALTKSDIMTGQLPMGQPNMVRVTNTFHPKRSGNIHIVADQHAVLMHYPWNLKPGLHGSTWSYDTYVPIMFAGPGITPARVARLVGPHDIAPTLANYLGIKPPSGSVGTPLTEVLQPAKP